MTMPSHLACPLAQKRAPRPSGAFWKPFSPKAGHWIWPPAIPTSRRTTFFGLIRHLGKKTTGALVFLPAGQLPKALTPYAWEVTLGQLQERIEQHNQVAFSIWDRKVHISVADLQDKLLVHRHLVRYLLVDGAFSSTHSPKPKPLNAALPHMVANEHFCMRFSGTHVRPTVRKQPCSSR